MMFDGVAGPPFDEIPNGISGLSGTGVAFSDDGGHYAYVARQGQQWVVMADGKEVARGTPFGQGSGNPTVASIGFTPGGKHLYFSTYDQARGTYPWQFYFDGKPDAPLRDGAQPAFSPDGEHYAYVFQVNVETGNPLPALMVDGKRAPYAGGAPQWTADSHLYTTMGVPRASAMDVLLDGKPIMRVGGVVMHMAPSGPAMLANVLVVDARGQRNNFLTIGNRRIPNSDCRGSAAINGVFFSADVKHWAIRCQDSNTAYWVMADGKKGQDYQSINSEVAFTAEGLPVYVATANAKQFVVVGDQELGPYGTVQLQFTRGASGSSGAFEATSVAGSHVGFIAAEGTGGTTDRLVVVDGKVIKGQASSDFAFSPDGSHFAYVDGWPNRAVVLDGTRRIAAPLVFDPNENPKAFVFSQDGKHLAFGSQVQSNAPGRGVAIDDGIFPTDAISTHGITFTPDGRHLLWMGVRSGNRRRIYVDGEPALDIDQPAGPQQSAETWWSMGADGVLTVVAQDGGALKRFRITPGTSSVDSRKKGP
jgi:WD40 repeat protein